MTQIVKEAKETGNNSIVARKHDIVSVGQACRVGILPARSLSDSLNRWMKNYKKYGNFYPKKGNKKLKHSKHLGYPNKEG
ncbi:hypothetical protein DK28_0214005 [Peptococcaceae bacterium SCADC1_2_3]|nr:hypothetical protein DK28_0214005 [Peptococcaceae bacterium SCADC1_2_3]